MHYPQSHHNPLRSAQVPLPHYDQMVDVLNHVLSKLCPVNQDLRPVILQVHDQSVRTQVSEIGVCAENHFPTVLQLVSLQLSDEELQSE